MEMFELLQGYVLSLFFPGIFRAWDTGFVLLAHAGSRESRENPQGTSLKRERSNFGNFHLSLSEFTPMALELGYPGLAACLGRKIAHPARE